nr:ATP-dependent DNA helicase PIF1-like [Tanacetum cinerariifolium]
MDSWPELTTADRADIVDRVFKQKVRDYIRFVRTTNLFGDIILGCKSFREIRSVNDIAFPTNRAACETLGFIGSDQEWVTALEEATLHASSDELRKLFVQILMFCDASDLTKLWQNFLKEMSHDIPRRLSRLLQILQVEQNETEMKAGTLFEIEAILNSNSRTLEDFGLPMPPRRLLNILENRVIMEERNYNRELLPSAEDLQKKVIVCPKNETADIINSHTLPLLNEQERVYLSSDEATPHCNDGGETELLYPSEYLNSLNFPGLPPHRLQLKVGAPIILLRNLNLTGGLCNGTRMIVMQLLNKVIEARIITCIRISEKVFLPRISLINRDLEMPFLFKRKQFLVKLSYAITINKSQAHNEVHAKADITDAPLTDYIGCIHCISDSIISGDATRSRKTRRIIYIQNLDGLSLPFLIWDEMVEKFDLDEYGKMPKLVIIAVSSTWATTKYGGLQLSATPATYYYFNPNILEVHYILDVTPSAEKYGAHYRSDGTEAPPIPHQLLAGTTSFFQYAILSHRYISGAFLPKDRCGCVFFIMISDLLRQKPNFDPTKVSRRRTRFNLCKEDVNGEAARTNLLAEAYQRAKPTAATGGTNTPGNHKHLHPFRHSYDGRGSRLHCTK